MHEQQGSVCGEVSIVYVDRHLTIITSLKFIRVLETRGHIMKNHLLRTMLPVRANGRVQQNGQVIGHARYINILACLQGF